METWSIWRSNLLARRLRCSPTSQTRAYDLDPKHTYGWTEQYPCSEPARNSTRRGSDVSEASDLRDFSESGGQCEQSKRNAYEATPVADCVEKGRHEDSEETMASRVTPERAATWASTVVRCSRCRNRCANGRPHKRARPKHELAPRRSPTQPMTNPIQGPYTKPAAIKMGGDGSGAITA